MTNSAADGMSLAAMLEGNAAQFGARPAILGESGRPLSHGELFAQTVATARSLHDFGLGRGDRVAVALPPGPELAVAVLAVAAVATAAPLNPASLEKEFAFHLEDLPARALILPQASDSPARAAAAELRLPVLELAGSPDGGGRFTLSGAARAGNSAAGFAGAEDVALVLHTSGTTSRPKRVPLSHANLCASARHIAATLRLRPDDISLTMMPLFHIHGLVAGVLAALAAGGSSICTGAFAAERFPRWLETFSPTWFSAVPTMHQAILEAARDRSFRAPALRFIRSSSAALPPALMAGLEEVFGVPVIESYGMTEAAHQMTSNPLPPRARKPGSVGLAAGPETAILDEAGGVLASGVVGEVAIRGPNVTRGYENNPPANAAAFCGGWFRTGDQGCLDAEGYLFLTGRLKELINRGGEKIAPREIDEALLAHPAVRQAVAFAVPHASLGEDVAAAVVLKSDGVCSEAELRAFALERLPVFKAPSRIIFIDEMLKGPTGKLQRIGLAERLADFLVIAYEPPATEMEKLVATTISEVLRQPRVGRDDNFFALGGDSLRATQVLIRLQQTLALELPAPLLFRLPTPALLGARLEALATARELDALAAALAALSPEDQARLLDGAPPSEP